MIRPPAINRANPGRSIAVLLCALVLPALTDAREITKPTVWEGRVIVNEPVFVKAGGALAVNPGADVHFAGAGRVECNDAGAFRAESAVFRADAPLAGHSRLRFSNCKSAVFEDCTFRGLVCPESGKHVDSAIRAVFTRFALRRCRVEDCSSLAVLHTTAPEFLENRFARSLEQALIVWFCDRAQVLRNSFHGGPRTSFLLYLKAARNTTVASNRFFGAGREWGAVLRYNAHGNTLAANAFFDCRTGILIHGGDNWGNTLVGNLIFEPQYFGIRLREAGADITIANCVVWGAKNMGLYVEGMTAPATVRNSVFGAGRRGIRLSGSTALPVLQNNCFWNNREAPNAATRAAMDAGHSVLADPLFVAPEDANFRLQVTAFGYTADSPLLNAGMPDGVSIGLYPHFPAPAADSASTRPRPGASGTPPPWKRRLDAPPRGRTPRTGRPPRSRRP